MLEYLKLKKKKKAWFISLTGKGACTFCHELCEIYFWREELFENLLTSCYIPEKSGCYRAGI